MIRINALVLLSALLVTCSFVFAQQSRQTILFNDGWKFHKGDIANGNAVSLSDDDWRNVDLPHDWSIEGPFDEKWASATAYLPAGIGWYRKTFTVPANFSSKKYFYLFRWCL